MQVSGIPPLEYQMNKQLRGNKEYEEYKRTTPILIPKLFS
jgi:steroid 5-alpha reductase family enzyme